MPTAPEYCQVSTTTDAPEAAAALTRSAVSSRLAACGQVIGPISSTYWWAGDVDTAQEWLVLLKTATDRSEALIEHIRKRHSYDEPEIICTPIVAGSPGYLAWIRRETRAR